MDTTKAITHIGLCAGYGGIELGLKRVLPTLQSAALCEIEAFPIANLVAKMEAGLMESSPIWTDLKTFPWESFRDRVDILSGGYPCQPFSSAGKRAGKEDPRHLWPWIADGIRILRPRVCFFENVEGHISLGLSSVISDLEELGYKVSWGIFSASEVGAPHQRKRVFILAYSADQRPEWGSILGSPSASEAVKGCGAWNGGSYESELADSKDQHGRHTIRQEAQDTKSALCGKHLWPSRPGEPQHGWEPPRVVANSEGQRARGRSELCDEERGSGGTLPRLFGKPSEVVGNAESEQGSSRDHRGEQGSTCEQEQVELGGGNCGALRESNWQAQPSLGGDSNGPSDWMDHAELYTTCDNRTDELRLLGNGVVPATAERAFRTLLTELLTNKTI